MILPCPRHMSQVAPVNLISPRLLALCFRVPVLRPGRGEHQGDCPMAVFCDGFDAGLWVPYYRSGVEAL